MRAIVHRVIESTTFTRDTSAKLNYPDGIAMCDRLLAGLRRARAEAEAIDPSGPTDDADRHLVAALRILRAVRDEGEGETRLLRGKLAEWL